jgi:hypothetical protein
MTDTKLITDGLRRSVSPMFIDHKSYQCHGFTMHIQDSGLEVNSRVSVRNGFTVNCDGLSD